MGSLTLLLLIIAATVLIRRQGLPLRTPLRTPLRPLLRPVRSYNPLPVRMHRRWYVTSAPNRHRM